MSTQAAAGRRDPSPAVSRSMRILGLLAESNRPLSLTEIANQLGLAKSSTGNLCLALEAANMVQKTSTGYRLGRRTAELGGAFAAQFNQVREFYGVCEASPVLAREVVQVAMLDDHEALYIARQEGSRTLRLGTPLGSRLPAALCATGKAMLMTMTDAEVGELLKDHVPFPKVTERSIQTLPELLDQLSQARSDGWAVDDGASFHGIVGVAVPLESWAPTDPMLALGVALRSPEATPQRIRTVAEALLEAADALRSPLKGPRRAQAI